MKHSPKDAQRAYNFCLTVWDSYFVYDLLGFVTKIYGSYAIEMQTIMISFAWDNLHCDNSMKQVLKAKTLSSLF